MLGGRVLGRRKEFFGPLPPIENILTKYERNSILTAIEESGASTTEFELDVISKPYGSITGSRPVVSIRHSKSGAFFHILPSIENVERLFYAEGQIGNGDPALTESDKKDRFYATISLGPPLPNPMGMNYLARCVNAWAEVVACESRLYEATSDLWAELRQSGNLLAVPGENIMFTVDEQAEISSYIKKLKEDIRSTYKLTAGDMAKVVATLDQVEEASRRMGAKDWLMLFNGAVFSLVVTDLVPPQALQHILLMTFHTLGHLFGIGAPPPPLPPYAG
jgi:hypothetical protein